MLVLFHALLAEAAYLSWFSADVSVTDHLQVELAYYDHGGILPYVIRKIAEQQIVQFEMIAMRWIVIGVNDPFLSTYNNL